MKMKLLFIVLLTSITINVNSQNFSTWSGSIRTSGMWGLGFTVPEYAVWLTRLGFKDYHDYHSGDASVSGWLHENHKFFRFFNVGYDFLFPYWIITSSSNEIELVYSYKHFSFVSETFGKGNYINYLGYIINWRSPFSKYGLYFGIDYEWRCFALSYLRSWGNTSSFYQSTSHNEIHSLVPFVGIRYRLISPEKEIDGFPINIVLEAGMSYAAVIKYENDVGYTADALKNGFKSLLGVAITTNRFGSLHVRWTKDLYNLFSNDYIATDGFLYNNELKNNFSCISIGWATFL